MNIEEAIEKLKRQITVGKCEKNIGIPVFISDLETLLTAYEKEKRLAKTNLKDSEEFQDNMCNHRCILNSKVEELESELEKALNEKAEVRISVSADNQIRKLQAELEKEKEKNKELEYIIASNTTREVISNLKNSRKSREDLEMLDLGWKEELKEKFQNTRNEILSQTLIKVTDRYWMDKCLEYINNLEKELIGEE